MFLKVFGLIWSLFSCRHLYLSSILQGMLSTTGVLIIQHVLRSDRCSKNINLSYFNHLHIWEHLSDHSRRTKIFHVTSCNFCILNSKSGTLEIIIIVILFSFSFFFGDRRPIGQRQSTGGSWPLGKFSVKKRGDFTSGNRTANLFLEIRISLHHHPVV